MRTMCGSLSHRRAEAEARVFVGAGHESAGDQCVEYWTEKANRNKRRLNTARQSVYYPRSWLWLDCRSKRMIKPDRIVTSTCPYCGVGCTLQLHVKDDFIFKVTSPFDSPVNHGNLCVKGRFGYDYVYHPKRVTTPLIRKITAKSWASARRPF